MCVTLVQKIPTGCRTIDKILEGGIPFESVSLIYGEAETGKTTLAIQCAINCAGQGYKTLFVDCDGTFSTRRLSQMASERFKEIAELIILMKPNNFREQTLVIDQLTDYITKNFGLVIIWFHQNYQLCNFFEFFRGHLRKTSGGESAVAIYK